MSVNQADAYSLVQGLADELSAGDLHLPALSESVMNIRSALADPDYSIDRLARVLRSEPALVGTILTMANSFTFRRNGKPTTDISAAISRLGASAVQSATMTFAMRQLRERDEYRQVEHLLRPAWADAARTAASCYLIARGSGRVSADESLVVGLLHNIGVIYLYSRAPQYPELFDDAESAEQLIRTWHPSVGKAIAEYWRLPNDAVTAIERQCEPDVEEREPMIDVLTLGTLVSRIETPVADETLALLNDRPDLQRLGIARSKLNSLIAERDELRDSLGLG